MTKNVRINKLMCSPQPWLTDGGLETDMIFNQGLELPMFASFTLLERDGGRQHVEQYFDSYLQLAAKADTGFVLDTATWRAGTEWGARMGRDATAVAAINAEAVAHARAIRDRAERPDFPIVINGVVGPSGDGYVVGAAKTESEAEAAHFGQISALAKAGVDMISAVTMTNTEEAIGIVRACKRVGIPVVVSFTLETDGHLPSGMTLAEAITYTDTVTGSAPLYYMINCAHPDHFHDRLIGDGAWKSRIGAVRANASRLSHAELDVAETLDDGDPEEFGRLYQSLAHLLPELRVIGGCCGTDHRHVGCAMHAILKPEA